MPVGALVLHRAISELSPGNRTAVKAALGHQQRQLPEFFTCERAGALAQRGTTPKNRRGIG